MRVERFLLPIVLILPVAIALLGWPAFVKWAAGPAPQPTPEVAGAAATSVASARVNAPTPRPTVGAPPTVTAPTPGAAVTRAPTQAPTQVVAAQPAATRAAPATAPAAPATAPAAPAAAPAAPAPTPVAAPAAPTRAPAAAPPTSADDPSATVSQFYDYVAQHDFGSAATLWSPRMRSTYPPSQNINERFTQTRSIVVNRADVVSEDASQAAVAVDLLEASGGATRHWVGTWYLVRGPNGWLLDQPALRGQ